MKVKLLNTKMFRYIDWWTVLLILAISLYGVVAIANATCQPFTGDESSLSDFLAKIDFSYVRLQLIWIAIGLVAMFVATLPDYTAIADYAKWVYWANIALLVLVFLTSEVRGMTGWFRFGERGFQPSEVAKIALIIMLSKLLADKTKGKHPITHIKDIIPICVMFAIPFALIILQKDWGTALVYVSIFFGILFVGRTSLKVMGAVLLTGLLLIPIGWLIMNDIQRGRILAFLNPELDPQGSGWQVSQSKIAIGSGRLTGKGIFAVGALGQLNYVPDSHTDFIFGVTAEAVGFLGSLLLILMYLALLMRALYIAAKAKDDLGSFIVIGVVCMTLFHIFENIGMNMGIMPVTGIPLPFFSYGGSNMLTNMLAFGLIINVNMRRYRWSF